MTETRKQTLPVHFSQHFFVQATSFRPNSASPADASDQQLLGHAFFRVLRFDPCASHWRSPRGVGRQPQLGFFEAHSECENDHSTER